MVLKRRAELVATTRPALDRLPRTRRRLPPHSRRRCRDHHRTRRLRRHPPTLLGYGYTATAGNRYTRPVPDLGVTGGPVPELAVDLLVPSLDGRFRSQEYGGRAFDSAPGLALSLAAEPVLIETSARMLHGDTLEFTVAVPAVELALVIKALSYGSRLQDRDAEDIYRLLEIADTYPPEAIGGWRLHEPQSRASRRDSAVHLHALARHSRRLRDLDMPTSRLATLVASLVGRQA